MDGDSKTGIIFRVHSVLCKHIRLTNTQWRHIRKRKELHSQTERMKTTLSDPDQVYYVRDEDSYYYYKSYEQTPVSKKQMLVVAKHIDDEDGFVITSFYVRRISKPAKRLIYEGLSQKPKQK